MDRLSHDEAVAYVDALYERNGRRWAQRVNNGPFTRQLVAGTLPLDAFRLFFRNYGAFTIEINTIVAALYQKHLPFFKQNPDLMAAMGDKIADEFVHPRPPGHYLVMRETAAALDISEDDLLQRPMLAEFRGRIDFNRSLLYEGTLAETYGAFTNELLFGQWCGLVYEALTTRYGFTPEQAVYFNKHHEADLEEHDEGVMAHGSFNRMVLTRLLETGQGWERPTYGVEYCAYTATDLHAAMLRATLTEYERQRTGEEL
jgi:pyrroloquinoline quinone (PQQ) biosynthesis protein C